MGQGNYGQARAPVFEVFGTTFDRQTETCGQLVALAERRAVRVAPCEVMMVVGENPAHVECDLFGRGFGELADPLGYPQSDRAHGAR